MVTPRRRKGKRKPPTAEQKLADKHKSLARSLFQQIGFYRVPAVSGRDFVYSGITSEFDDVFVLENVLVVAEYTSHGETHVADHLRKKIFLYDKIKLDDEIFVKFLRSRFPSISSALSNNYADHHFQVRIVYASRNALRPETKALTRNVTYLDYNYLRYFANVSATVRLSARFEFLDFLSITSEHYGSAIVAPSAGGSIGYEGSVLPEAHSHFPAGFKVVSFYVDAEALLSRAYVLRRDGWRSDSGVYQRMISRKKVEAIRRHLLDGNGVFVNNVIVTLPSDTKLLDKKNDTIDVSTIRKTTPGKISLPSRFNSVGLIDGQHRIFSYHEGGFKEPDMAILRKQQNLLVTGIMFPQDMHDAERTRFEARLFLEINSTQTNAKSDLKQEIGLILKPYSPESIAKRVVTRLNDDHGPLSNHFERYFYEMGKLKTTTVVSYGLRPLVRVGGDESLFEIWGGEGKDGILKENDDAALAAYIVYSAKQINHFIGAAKSNIDADRWTTNRMVENRVLNTTFVNGLIFCLRRLVKARMESDFDGYRTALRGINDFDFSMYKSSQYNKMGEALFNRYFMR